MTKKRVAKKKPINVTIAVGLKANQEPDYAAMVERADKIVAGLDLLFRPIAFQVILNDLVIRERNRISQ